VVARSILTFWVPDSPDRVRRRRWRARRRLRDRRTVPLLSDQRNPSRPTKPRPSAKGTRITSTSITISLARRDVREARQHDQQGRARHRRRRDQRRYDAADGNWDRQQIVPDRKPEVLPHQMERLARKIDRRDYRGERLAQEHQIGCDLTEMHLLVTSKHAPQRALARHSTRRRPSSP
jgi:hypothetical protein